MEDDTVLFRLWLIGWGIILSGIVGLIFLITRLLHWLKVW